MMGKKTPTHLKKCQFVSIGGVDVAAVRYNSQARVRCLLGKGKNEACDNDRDGSRLQWG